MTVDGKTPLSNKRYYDILTYVVTQLSFTFTVAPFIILGFSDSLKVWSRVWFYCLIGIAASFGFLNSPLKVQLSQALKRRAASVASGSGGPSASYGKPSLERNESYNSTHVGGGIPDDPEKEFGEIVKEVREEIEKRKRRGSVVPDFRVMLKEKIDEWKKMGGTVADSTDAGIKVE
jgi:lysophospholipid acyltransferase